MILKKSTEKERECLDKLMKDILRPYIPEYKGEVPKGNERILDNIVYFILLKGFISHDRILATDSKVGPTLHVNKTVVMLISCDRFTGIVVLS